MLLQAMPSVGFRCVKIKQPKFTSVVCDSVIPAVEEVVLVYLKHSKRCAIFAVCAHITLTDELTC